MKQDNTQIEEIIPFLRKRDYKLVRGLGQGACGKTVLLYDDEIEEYFVCKKYAPYSEAERESLFSAFIREIKLLHQIQHTNVVRVFNYYLYPAQFSGYILMEFVNGTDIEDYLKRFPEKTNELFLQAISGFSYLERSGILHRDIRPNNIMVNDDGMLKIIDLGFGKLVRNSEDFDKSISLNWWCQPPLDFSVGRYDFTTEVYFVGKLFERIIQENEISHFKYADALGKMCALDPLLRIQSFVEIEKAVRNNQFFEIEFSKGELQAYRNFADSLFSHITKIDSGAKYTDDIVRIQTQLNDIYRNFMLELHVPDAAVVLRCFLVGAYYYKKPGLATAAVRDFVRLLKSSTEEKNRIVLANLQTRLDAVPRYFQHEEDDIPF